MRGRYGGGEGDGPGELRRLAAVAAAPDGVLVSDGGRVNHWDAAGNLLSIWQPGASTVTALCSLAGEPAAALFDGVIRRSPDGGGIRFGSRLASSESPATDREGQIGAQEFMEFATAHIACMGGVAYVQMGNRLLAHRPEGLTSEIRIPPPLAQDAAARRPPPDSRRLVPWYGSLSTNGRGRLVLGQFPRRGHEVVGAVFDPLSGCYSLIEDRGDRLVSRRFMGVHADSAIIYGRHTRSREVEGRTMNYAEALAYQIALHPLRRVSGEPCPPPPGSSR